MEGTELPTAAQLERVALRYVERYGGSTERVRRVLGRRVARAAEETGADPEPAIAAIDAVIGKLTRLGYLDDARFVESRVRVLRKRGKSARAIRAALSAQGVDGHLGPALDDQDAELSAARAFVRRRRLGPHRPTETRDAERQRDLARLARAGFSYDVAVRALSGEP